MDIDVVMHEGTGLPNDVLHAILSESNALSTADLARAARVCKAWQDAATPLLYKAVEISVPDTKLAPVLWGAPHLRARVKNLTVKVFRHNEESDVRSALGWLAWKGVRIEELSIVAAQPVGLGIRELEVFLEECRLLGIKMLSVWGPLTLFLRPELEQLALLGHPLPYIPDAEDLDAVPLPHLRQLTLGECAEVPAPVRRLIRHVCATLQRLDLSSSSLTQLAHFDDLVDLKECAKLTHLSVVHFPAEHFPAQAYTYGWFLPYRAPAPPPVCEAPLQVNVRGGPPLHALRISAVVLQYLAALPAVRAVELCAPGVVTVRDAQRLAEFAVGQARVEQVLVERECAEPEALDVLRASGVPVYLLRP